MAKLSINLQGDGEPTSINLELKGSPCRCEDFQMALVKFANQWVKEANRPAPRERKPCGCKDKA